MLALIVIKMLIMVISPHVQYLR